MKKGDLIVGILFMVSGALLYLQNYRKPDKKGKMGSLVGKLMLVVGTWLAFGQLLYKLAFSDK